LFVDRGVNEHDWRLWVSEQFVAGGFRRLSGMGFLKLINNGRRVLLETLERFFIS
jgi:hypothetical protein